MRYIWMVALACAAGVQAAIGLVNSTPYLGRVDRAALKPMLTRMATAALTAI